MFVVLFIVTCFSLAVNPNEAAKILAVFPFPSISHQVVFRPITQELARRGHEVTVITTDPAFPKGETPANLTEIDVHDISYSIWREQFKSTSKGSKGDLPKQYAVILKSVVAIVDAQLKEEQVQNLIRDVNKQFDLILLEPCGRPAMIFSHIFKAPVIHVSSFGDFVDSYEIVGAPIHPILYPGIIRQRLHNLTMWEKITELYLFLKREMIHRNSYTEENNMLRKHFGSNIPSIEELNNNVAMLFLNVRQVFAGNRPVPPSVVYMGGLHQTPNKELPTELKSYLDSSKNGVIYISFGTNVDPTLLPREQVQVLVRTFSQLPYDVLWKWNNDVLPGRTDNIKISKWLPQSDLLKHPKIKLFVTQGGLQSTDEAITAGVPLIGIPMLGDQWHNVENYLKHGIGLRLDLDTLTEEKFKNAINTVITDDSYRKNIKRLLSIMQDEPMRPLERAVWWTEHVLRHGGASHLRAPAANISWAQYLELELVLTLSIGLLITLAVFILIIRKPLTYIYQNVLKDYVPVVKIKYS